ncbi:Deoxyuridine 5'-triphosphate nucleotidohydrolase Short=dUTPase; AltName: Full=dUTP pyrophosphatase [Serendipita indica DSM 11827]|nr:Deoxyuridine 5'-triphosphate nucleotidohydrolase Short=dUTPase; AltName: Full=dUTP pyrophosphatase [Serendipita indica DSM 11827]
MSDLKRPASPHPEQRPSKVLNTSDQPTVEAIAVSSAVADTVKTADPKSVPSRSLLIKRLNENARLPTRGSALAAGYDLYSGEDTTIPAGGKALVNTHISLAVPEGTYGRVAPRSGLASKHMIATGAGVVDADYRGPLFILLFNHGEKEFKISIGDRIAQLILEKIETPPVVEVQDLEETLRGAGGFGSTGL